MKLVVFIIIYGLIAIIPNGVWTEYYKDIFCFKFDEYEINHLNFLQSCFSNFIFKTLDDDT